MNSEHGKLPMSKGSGLVLCGGTEGRAVELISASREVRSTTCASYVAGFQNRRHYCARCLYVRTTITS
jgi:hypothetical protein